MPIEHAGRVLLLQRSNTPRAIQASILHLASTTDQEMMIRMKGMMVMMTVMIIPTSQPITVGVMIGSLGRTNVRVMVLQILAP